MLDYENQIFLDLLENDALVISSKGLEMEQVILNFMRAHCDPKHLVFVLGASADDEVFYVSELEKLQVSPLPRLVTADVSVKDRSEFYLEGGVLFASNRILVVDMLMDRVPINLISGFIVLKAHRVVESCQDAFILRLYRQKNKTGFVKAFSSSPLSFTQGFCQVSRVMRSLFVAKLQLWPRVHASVKACLEQKSPEVIEVHLQMSEPMMHIQASLLDLIEQSVKEIKRCNPSLDLDEVTTEDALTRDFGRLLKKSLDPIWHQLSQKTRQLIADLNTLRSILYNLTQSDCVTFERMVTSLRTTEMAIKSSGWLLMDSAQTLFLEAKKRVLQEKPDTPLEVSPKWNSLAEILDEEKRLANPEPESKRDQDGAGPSSTLSPPAGVILRVLIVAHDEKTCVQIKQFLTYGAQEALSISKAAIASDPNFAGLSRGWKRRRRRRRRLPAAQRKGANKRFKCMTLTQMVKKDGTENGEAEPEVVDLEDAVDGGAEDGEAVEEEEEDEEDYPDVNQIIPVVESIKNDHDPRALDRVLYDLHPIAIVLYDVDISFIRKIEIYKARNPDRPLRVYMIVYAGTFEEQAYLTSIRKEKQAFKFLAQEKSTMTIPEDAEGRGEDHPDLQRDPTKASDMAVANLAGPSSRRGGVMDHQKAQGNEYVIVDMREFRSELPSLVHRRGIDILPVTIEVGDYVLTPEICVERKSISDLIQSLISGRLYNQAQAMTRTYARPVLLIEFDHNKPFTLNHGRYYFSKDASSTDVSARLQLLTLHFPKLKILWSPGPYATAELFHQLKEGKPQPDVETTAGITAEENIATDDKFNPVMLDFLGKLPGLNTRNLKIFMRRVKDIDQLLAMSEADISKALESSANGKLLYDALHTKVKESDASFELAASKKGKKGSRFRALGANKRGK